MKLKFIYLFCILILFSCNSEKKEVNSKEQLSLSKTKFIDINIKDTLNVGKEYGSIGFLKALNDTTKFDTNDERILFVYLNLFSLNDDIMNIKKSKCDSFSIVTNQVNKKINCPIYVTPKTSGDYKIMGVLEDYIFLNSYNNGTDSSKVRMIKNKYYFEKKIFVTSTIDSL